MLEKFEDLLGVTLTDIRVDQEFQDEIIFVLENGEQYKLTHLEDCCEAVVIEDINGDLSDLIGSEILMAEEATGPKPLNATSEPYEIKDVSETWTFYKLATRNGYVTIRWFGSSNGHYSESVDWIKKADL